MGTKQIRCPHRLRAEQERKDEMGLGKSRKYAAVLLTAAILSADVCGAGSTVYGAQQEKQTKSRMSFEKIQRSGIKMPAAHGRRSRRKSFCSRQGCQQAQQRQSRHCIFCTVLQRSSARFRSRPVLCEW